MGTVVARPRPRHAVALSGAGALCALGEGLEPLRRALRTGASGLADHPHLAGQGYQSTVCGLVPSELTERLRRETPDLADARAFLFARHAMGQAIREASALFQQVPPARRGFVLSTTKADIEALERLHRGQMVSPAAQRHLQPGLLAEDLAVAHDLQGPCQCVSAACISGLLALQQGAALLRRNDADLVVVAGVDLASAFVLAGFTTLKSLDPQGCRPFDQARVGLSLGEGAGAVVLARAELLAGPRVLLTGWGSSNDANHLTGPSRDGAGLALAINRALAKAGVAPQEIDYLNAHGTGTAYNDAMESLAFRAVFGETVPPFSSSKGVLGHTLGAAGVLETILGRLGLEEGFLPGTPGLSVPDPLAPPSPLREGREAPDARRVLKVNCGFGGTNAAVILEKEEA